MRQLFQFLKENPLVALIVIGWIFSAVGGVIAKARRQAAQQGQRPARGGGRDPAARRAGGPSAQQVPGRPSAEQVAAEMRRILGMDQAPRPPVERPSPPAPLRPSSYEPPSPERAPTPLQPSSLGNLQLHGDPHVGDRIEKRQTPATGAVGAQQLGGLGGRAAPVRRRRRMASRLVDLHDLPRALVLREVIDRPLSLRRDW